MRPVDRRVRRRRRRAKAAALDDIDDVLDELHRDYIAQVLERCRAGSIDIQAAVQLALVGRYYERIGDHAVNIGERVRYMVSGWMPEHHHRPRPDAGRAERVTLAPAWSRSIETPCVGGRRRRSPPASSLVAVAAGLAGPPGPRPAGRRRRPPARGRRRRRSSTAGSRRTSRRLERAVDRAVLRGGETSRRRGPAAAGDGGDPPGRRDLRRVGRGRVPQRDRRRRSPRPATARRSSPPPSRSCSPPPSAAPATAAPSTCSARPGGRSCSRSYPLDDERRTVGALVVIDDVTERRRLEAVRRDFVANISHELKTPVGALGLLAETIARRGRPGRRPPPGRADAARGAPGRPHDRRPARAVAHRGRGAAPAGAGAGAPRRRRGGRAGPLGRRAARDAHRGRRAGEAPRPSLGDRRQLVSAVYNLLDNATKYSEPGSPIEVVHRASTAATSRSTSRDHGHRHPDPRPRADLRALLPGRPGPQPGDRRHRARAGHRPPRRRQPRRRGAASRPARARARRSPCRSRPARAPT